MLFRQMLLTLGRDRDDRGKTSGGGGRGDGAHGPCPS